MIEFRNVSRRYGKRTAVADLTLTAPGGEVFAYLGPNGAGKTTTIKMLVGLLQPHAGGISIGGVDVRKQPREACRLLGYVPDQPFLYDKLSARETLQFVAGMYGMGQKEAADAIERQIATFELGGFCDRLSEGYSHGMKQRVVFASALVHNPRVVVVDEPMVGLDPRSMRLVKDLLRRFADEGGAVFMSTHTLSVADEIADRIGVLSQGRLLFCGAVGELRERLAERDGSLERLFLKLTEEMDDDAATAEALAGPALAGRTAAAAVGAGQEMGDA